MKRATFITWEQLKVGGMILLALAILTVAVFKLGEAANLFSKRYELIAYLPKERILMYGDGYNPPAGNEIRTPERGPDYAAQLVDKVKEFKLNPDRIAPVHGRVVPYKNLLIAFNLDGATAPRGTK